MAIPVKYLKKTKTEPLLKAALLNSFVRLQVSTGPLSTATITMLNRSIVRWRRTFLLMLTRHTMHSSLRS